MALMGRYVLIATCDDRRHVGPPRRFIGQSAGECLRDAEHARWSWNMETHLAFCPDHPQRTGDTRDNKVSNEDAVSS